MNETGDKPLVSSEPRIPSFSTDKLPEGEWQTFRKTALTSMLRIDGPFEVETSEGTLRCEDGWLAIDRRGYPYPIAADEQALIYEEVTESEAVPGVPENYPEREQQWKRTAGRCVACDGYTTDDQALLCPMCADPAREIDPFEIMAIRSGTDPRYITATSVTKEVLPFDGTYYYLPDGSKAPEASIDQALQNWRESNVAILDESSGSITEPVR